MYVVRIPYCPFGFHGKKVFNFLYCAETYSEAVKILKGEYVIKAIEEHKMDRALIFCRTKVDCDNLEKYLQQRGQGNGLPIT